jgi:hypothetical protein
VMGLETSTALRCIFMVNHNEDRTNSIKNGKGQKTDTDCHPIPGWQHDRSWQKVW